MLTLNDGRSELWQWDTKRKLTVDADCSKVHFSNKILGRSIDVNVIDGIAVIPDFLLQTDKELMAWAFVGTPENGYTKISKVFKVNKRNKPADYVFTPPEQTTLAEIMERIDDLESIQDPDAIKNAVDDYLANNPITVKETDPTVPDWAKNEKKPTYTADEVGALSKTELSGAVSDALAQAKASGEFDGEPGAPGQDYVLTDADKEEIAEMAAGLVEIPDSGGNVAYDEVQNLTDEQKSQARENIGAQPVGSYLDSTELTTAINTALAQAKESGEFDGKDGVDGQPGKDGYTPVKGVDYFDGKDGKDGVVAVTGATVGQTVKISAVDENGVPTAWESVEFPSGGSEEVWENVCDITIGEDVYTQHILTEAEGKKFKKLLISFERCGTKNRLCCKKDGIYPDVYSSVSNDIAGSIGGGAGGTFSSIVMKKDVTGKYFQCITGSSGISFADSVTPKVGPIKGTSAYGREYIGVITLYSTDASTPLTSGGKVVIEGVRF